MIVDDTTANLQVLNDALSKAGYRVRPLRGGRQAVASALAEPPDLVLLDIRMPGLDGFEVCGQLKADERTREIPVIFISALETAEDKVRAFEVGGVDYVTKPFQMPEVLARVATHLALRHSLQQIKEQQDELRQLNEGLETTVERRTAELISSRLDIVWRLSKAGEFRDEETGRHVMRVGLFAKSLAEALGLSSAEANSLFLTSPLHDVGKIGVSDTILLKPGPLTDDERAQMQQHCRIGQAILTEPVLARQFVADPLPDAGPDGNPLLRQAATIAVSHHERWDGSGYPNRLAHEDIPLEGRIVALVDVFDALSSERPYKPPFPPERVLKIMSEGCATHFDPAVFDAFWRSRPVFGEIQQAYSDHLAETASGSI
jgi:putative two-component system response regulator